MDLKVFNHQKKIAKNHVDGLKFAFKREVAKAFLKKEQIDFTTRTFYIIILNSK